MASGNTQYLNFNRGIVSPLALSRLDLARVGLSAEIQHNFTPRSLGSMMLRCGYGYIRSTKNNAKAVHLDFIRKLSDMASIEMTANVMRVDINETIITRLSVSTAFTNGTFDTNLTGWSDNDESGATSVWYTGGFMSLVGTRFNAAIRRQTLTISAPDQNVEHGLRIVVTRGKPKIRVGSTSGGDEYISETTLGVGTHSLAFTPAGASVYVELNNLTQYAALIDSIAIEAAGAMEIATSYDVDDIALIRKEQSVDVIYLACQDQQQQKIERRGGSGGRSWSIVKYEPEDGPFRSINTSSLTLTPSGYTGDISLTASKNFFKSTHAGALFRLISTGQTVTGTVAGADQYTDSIRITGLAAVRSFSISIAGTWVGTITMQRSVDDGGSWTDIGTYTGNTTTSFADGFDNQIYLYRFGFKPGNYTSGSADIVLSNATGSVTGIVRIISVTNSTTAVAQVLKQLGGTTATSSWYESEWSDYRGWPTAVRLAEGRLWWAGNDKIIGSVSDGYESFDDTIEGDSAPINRSIGSGAVAVINWIMDLQRLSLGAEMREHSISSSSLDEPLTTTAFNIKSPTTRGSAKVDAVKVDDDAFFVLRGGNRLMSLNYDGTTLKYKTDDMSILAPEIFLPGIVKLSVQRKPDTRIHCVMADGSAILLIHDTAENVKCLVTHDTRGGTDLVEDVVIFPSDPEDKVYYTIKRTINGGTVRYYEKVALESECQGGTLNKQADSFVTYTGGATTTVTAAHLANEDVIIWADGVDLSADDTDGNQILYTLNGSGQCTIASAASNYVVGLPYGAQFESTKLGAVLAQAGSPLTMHKKINRLGLNMHNTHPKGIKYGRSFDSMDYVPEVVEGAEHDPDEIFADYDHENFPFDGTWNTDSRLYLTAIAPRPCTIQAAVIGITMNEK